MFMITICCICKEHYVCISQMVMFRIIFWYFSVTVTTKIFHQSDISDNIPWSFVCFVFYSNKKNLSKQEEAMKLMKANTEARFRTFRSLEEAEQFTRLQDNLTTPKKVNGASNGSEVDIASPLSCSFHFVGDAIKKCECSNHSGASNIIIVPLKNGKVYDFIGKIVMMMKFTLYRYELYQINLTFNCYSSQLWATEPTPTGPPSLNNWMALGLSLRRGKQRSSRPSSGKTQDIWCLQ